MTSILRFLFSVLVLLSAISANTARADWMNLTGAETAPNIAEITVLDDRVRIALEVYVGDLRSFGELVPDTWLKKNVSERPSATERLRRFSEETLQVVTGDGTRLPAQLKLVEPRLRKDRASPFAGMINPTTRRRVPTPPEDKRVLYAEIEYPFDGKPNELIFIPPTDENGVAVVTIGFIAYHKAVPVIDFRYLSGKARLMLDWSDPWYSKFENPNLKRHHKSALMTFLYVEPREVRHEMLIRLRDLMEWIDLGLSGQETVGRGEQGRIKREATAFLADRNPLMIDGKVVKPASSRAEFLEISLTGLKVIGEEGPLDLSSATLGVILSYPVTKIPQQVNVDWDLFDPRIERIPATSIDPAGALPSFVEASDPNFEWKNYLLKYEEPRVRPVMVDDDRSIPVPVLSVLLLSIALAAAGFSIRPAWLSRYSWIGICVLSTLAGVLSWGHAVMKVPHPMAGPPDQQTASQIVKGVLENVNHAYIEREPAALREALGGIVANDSVDDIQAELGRALVVKVAGGGQARVNAIGDLELKEVTALDEGSGFRTVARWTAQAEGGHWGHVHRRKIQFRALMEVVESGGTWKLAGLTVVDAKQKN